MQFFHVPGSSREVFYPKGVCSKEITFDIEDGKLHNLHFVGGCPGNLLAISILLEGMPVEEIIGKLKGITCGKKSTSCSDQLAQILEQQLAKV